MINVYWPVRNREWSYILLVLPLGLWISCSPHNQQLWDTPLPTGIFHKALGSRCEALGVTGEHGGLTHIVETKVQHADSLQTNASSTMWRSPKTE